MPELFASLRGFAPAWLPSDAIAGLMLAAIAIPEQIATARLAGMPPQAGLYAFAAGSLAFAIFGRNRFLSVGADSTIAPIFAGAIAALAYGEAVNYALLVAAVAVVAGIALVLAGLLRAGWLADLLSIPVTTGFLAGIAVHIAIGQVPLVLGVGAASGDTAARLAAIWRALPQTHLATLAIGCGVLALALLAERVSPRIPGALVGLVCAGLVVAALHPSGENVAVLGALPASFPQFALPLVDVRDALQLVPIGLIVALVCLVQTSVVSRSYPSTPGATEDPSDDYVAIGIGSLAAGCIGGFAVDASPPRTAVAASSGGRSQLTGIVAVAAVALLAAFGAKLAAYLPLAALGGVLIFIAIRIVRVEEIARIARLGGSEIWLVVAGALLVLVFPIEIGMTLAIAFSLAHGIFIVARPPCVELLRVTGTTIWWPVATGAGERVPGTLVFSPEAPITFTNARFIVARLHALASAAPAPVRLVIIEGSGVSDVDYTGASIVSAAITALRTGGATVAIARLADGRARRAATRTGLLASLGPGRDFDSVHEAYVALAGQSSVAGRS
jgi:MFS superfamily sulfate permease-like transporter